MPSNIALAWTNLADSGTLTASGALTLAPVSNLQNRHIMRKWRVNATSAYFVCNLGSQQSISTIAVMGLSGVSPTLRVRISTADTSGAAGDVYDSGSLVGAFDSSYLPFVRLISSPVTGRYVRVDISEGGVAYIEAGRLFVGVRSTFGINFAPGWTPPYYVDPSIATVGRSGQTFNNLRDKYRTSKLTLNVITETELNNIVRAIAIALGKTGDLLYVPKPDSTNLGRDSVWGYFESDDPPIEPFNATPGPIFTKTYSIRERL